MIVLVLLIVGLAIEFWRLLSDLGPLILAVLVGMAVARLMLAANARCFARAAEAREHLRHERARREIDRIALDTRRAMLDAALRHGQVIEGTANEVKSR
jgi:hypothetical protein